MATMSSFDYIVIGAGTAGCVVAARLSQKGSVALLEAGGSESDTLPGVDVQETVGKYRNVLDAITKVSAVYVSEPQRDLYERAIPILRGVIRGGSSSINGMLYVRGNRRDYDLWASLGNEGWSFDEVLPYFRRSEHHAGGASPYHGAGGPLRVCPIPHPTAAARAFIDAAHHLGYADSAEEWDFNGPRQENAAGLYHVNIDGERRVSAASAFLDRFADGRALTLETRHRAVRILVERRPRGRRGLRGWPGAAARVPRRARGGGVRGRLGVPETPDAVGDRAGRAPAIRWHPGPGGSARRGAEPPRSPSDSPLL